MTELYLQTPYLIFSIIKNFLRLLHIKSTTHSPISRIFTEDGGTGQLPSLPDALLHHAELVSPLGHQNVVIAGQSRIPQKLKQILVGQS